MNPTDINAIDRRADLSEQGEHVLQSYGRAYGPTGWERQPVVSQIRLTLRALSAVAQDKGVHLEDLL